MWDIRYRPLKFSDVLGQPGTIKLLKSRLEKGTALDTSYIFSGGFGMGKTTIARIFARAMLCLNLGEDFEPCNSCENCTAILEEQPCAFSERDAASHGTIDHIRSIVDDLPFSVPNASKRVYLLDEFHRISTGAQDVLLKPVEEKKMVGLFCTTEAEKIRGTIRSRCEEYTIRKITREDILARMKDVLAKENVEYEEDAVLTVIDHSGGHVRDVLNKLETISLMGPITLVRVREHLKLSVVSTYYEILLALDDPKTSLELVDRACEQVSPEDVATGLAEAAMNSYRLENGMFSEFTYADKDLGKKVYSKYGMSVIKFAEYFLKSRYTSKISLMKDMVVLSQGPSNVTYEPQPITIVPSIRPSAPPIAPVEQQPIKTIEQPVSPSNTTSPHKNGVRKALTPTEDKANLEFTKPRMLDKDKAILVFPENNGETEEKRLLHPEEWRKRFENDWRRLYPCPLKN